MATQAQWLTKNTMVCPLYQLSCMSPDLSTYILEQTFHQLSFLSLLSLTLVFLSPLLDGSSPPYHPGPLVSQKQKCKGQLESMLIQHVVPEFQSQHGYLRARVSYHHQCWHHYCRHHHHHFHYQCFEHQMTIYLPNY